MLQAGHRAGKAAARFSEGCTTLSAIVGKAQSMVGHDAGGLLMGLRRRAAGGGAGWLRRPTSLLRDETAMAGKLLFSLKKERETTG